MCGREFSYDRATFTPEPLRYVGVKFTPSSMQKRAAVESVCLSAHPQVLHRNGCFISRLVLLTATDWMIRPAPRAQCYARPFKKHRARAWINPRELLLNKHTPQRERVIYYQGVHLFVPYSLGRGYEINILVPWWNLLVVI